MLPPVVVVVVVVFVEGSFTKSLNNIPICFGFIISCLILRFCCIFRHQVLIFVCFLISASSCFFFSLLKLCKMGRVKLPISRILNNTNRQVTYSKRRNGILKKAYEIAVLCDIDIALIMISPSGRITFFSGARRIEDVMLQYFNLDDEEIELDQDSEGNLVNDREGVISTLLRLKTEATANQSPKDLSIHVEEIIGLQHQLEMAKEQLRAFEPDPQKYTSLDELESCEEQLSKTLNLIEQRKKNLLSNHSPSYQETVEQIHSVGRYIWNTQAESTTPPALVNPNFSSWSEHLNKHDSDGPKYMYMGSDASPIFHESQSSTKIIGVEESDPTLHNDNQSPEGCKVRSLSEECLLQWHNSEELYLALMAQEMSHSLIFVIERH